MCTNPTMAQPRTLSPFSHHRIPGPARPAASSYFPSFGLWPHTPLPQTRPIIALHFIYISTPWLVSIKIDNLDYKACRFVPWGTFNNRVKYFSCIAYSYIHNKRSQCFTRLNCFPQSWWELFPKEITKYWNRNVECEIRSVVWEIRLYNFIKKPFQWVRIATFTKLFNLMNI